MLLSTIILQAAGAAVWGKVAGAAGAAVAALAAAWGIGKIGPYAQHLPCEWSTCQCRLYAHHVERTEHQTDNQFAKTMITQFEGFA